ncbi:hypothetical protein, conserved [Babesia bigemina]|uniref:ubiquitinyl hydrolase 1 n=1 Tax=Babesia bigemina TaxID=5866 RepID=A0A061DEM3_BABBI|nr:hypothetical protein, conserved [Babesia bigemina]CDR97530.1 hypothetical protein, conserved [Babesia bigemina]|eukprot:XP_012769716.1 hypothetical protein, conserved [Babesia bigemina]
MSNIKSFGDYVEDRREQAYSYAGGHNSALGVEDGHTVHLYAGGFTVDEGPFRPLSEPENALFLSAVRNGVAPPELREHGKDAHVYLIDDSHLTYNPPESHTNEPSTTKTTGTAISVQDIRIGTNSGNVTTLRIKLCDHRQINLKVSPETTIGELRSIISAKSGLSVSSFRLMYGFPPRELIANDSDTLNGKDLLGCAIFQHMII